MERYVAICRPFRARAMSSPPRAVRCVLASWALALVLAVPPATQFGVVEKRDSLGRDMSECTVKRVLVSHAFLLSTGLVFVAPLLVITVLYILIGLRLRRSRRALAARRHSAGSTGSVRASSASSTHSQARVIRMLVAVVVAFFICWAPFHAQRLLAVYASEANQRHDAVRALYTALTYMSGVLYYLSTTVNPFLYHIMSNKFREAFKNTLRTECGWWTRRRDAKRRQSYANLSGRARPCCGLHCGSSSLLPPHQAPHANDRSRSTLTLTTTFDERSNTYSTVEERAIVSCLRSSHRDMRGASADRCTANSVDDSGGSVTSALGGGRRSRTPSCCRGGGGSASCRPVSEHGADASQQRVNGNGVSSPRPRPGQPLMVMPVPPLAGPGRGLPASPPPSPTTPRPPSRSPIEALARKLRAIPARSVRSVRWHTGSTGGGGPGGGGVEGGAGGLRSDHSAISNSSLQEWDRAEQSGAELAELVKYMGELNQRHAAKL
ncbi:Pyrokinin Receptor [Frankliniella occidentalis]|nr:Pyrokinin Receptor [Frankliniella occidentalis]